MRKVYVTVNVGLVINADEGVEISEILDEMDYDFKDTTTKADIIDTEILDYTIEDSK